VVQRLAVRGTKWSDVGDAAASSSGQSGGVIFAKDRSPAQPGIVVKTLWAKDKDEQNPNRAVTSESLLEAVGVATPGARIASSMEKEEAVREFDRVVSDKQKAVKGGGTDATLSARLKNLETKLDILRASTRMLVMGQVQGESFEDMAKDPLLASKGQSGEDPTGMNARFERFATHWKDPDFQLHFGRIFAVDMLLGHKDRFFPETGLNYGNIMVTSDGDLMTIDNDAKLERLERGEVTMDQFALTEKLSPATLPDTVATLVAKLNSQLLDPERALFRKLTGYLLTNHADLFDGFAEKFTEGVEEARDQILQLEMSGSSLGVDRYYEGSQDFDVKTLRSRQHYLGLRTTGASSASRALKKVRKGY
jgi:hypothetical protein